MNLKVFGQVSMKSTRYIAVLVSSIKSACIKPVISAEDIGSKQ